MRILCVLQNAWGDRELPVVFIPNPRNKSAKVIKKMVGDNMYFFSNTTPIMTATAKGKPKPDYEHFLRLIPKFVKYDLILVCGNQAKETFNKFLDNISEIDIKFMYVPHPASRSLSNVQIAVIRQEIENYQRGTLRGV